MTEKITFAIVGFGNIGSRHATHILANEKSELVAVCDIDLQKKNLVPNGIFYYEKLEDLLANTKADVVCICTPNFLHLPHTLAALEAGSHAVVEKPMALSTADCDKMITAADDAGKLIFAVKQNRYNPPVQAVKELINKNRLGKIYLIEVNCFWNRGDAYYNSNDWRGVKTKDGGCLFTQFSHFVDILYYLNGGINSISGFIKNFAHGHNTEFEDSGVFSLEAENGSLISFNFSTAAYDKNLEGSIAIIAEKGSVKIGGQYLNTIAWQHIEGDAIPEILPTATANDYGAYQGSMSNHDKLIANVVSVLNNEAEMMTTAEEGKQVISIIEKMYAAAKEIS